MESKNEATRYNAVRVDDTTEWRLVVYISRSGMSAYLRNEEDPTVPVATLFEERWSEDAGNLLPRIESAVYDHPQVLDDFTADIIICTGRALWIPASELEEPGSETELYNKVYEAEEEDIFVDELEDMRCVYTLVPGLHDFIRRTLPGSNIHCQHTVAVGRYMERGAEMPRVYVDIRDGEADFEVLDDRRLLLSATHPWRDPMDIAYHAFNIMDVCGLDPKKSQVSLSGERDVKQQLLPMLRENAGYVMLTMAPTALQTGGMPLAAALLVSRISRHPRR